MTRRSRCKFPLCLTLILLFLFARTTASDQHGRSLENEEGMNYHGNKNKQAQTIHSAALRETSVTSERSLDPSAPSSITPTISAIPLTTRKTLPSATESIKTLAGPPASTLNPSSKPTSLPNTSPPTLLPKTASPTKQLPPTTQPTATTTPGPTKLVTPDPTFEPIAPPTSAPLTSNPTLHAAQATESPTPLPSLPPTFGSLPTIQPTATPTGAPTTRSPTSRPLAGDGVTAIPNAASPTIPPGFVTPEPTQMAVSTPPPTSAPTVAPSTQPPVSFPPTLQVETAPPTSSPTPSPTEEDTPNPTVTPTSATPTPTEIPPPTSEPTPNLSPAPTVSPLTPVPTTATTQSLTASPTTASPEPTATSPNPTPNPSARQTARPSNTTPRPTRRPTPQPTRQPTLLPSSPQDGTASPTQRSTSRPSSNPTRRPTGRPTRQPTASPTAPQDKIVSSNPTRRPTRRPTPNPTRRPTPRPTRQPSLPPSVLQETPRPTAGLSLNPTRSPTPDPFEASSSPTKSPSSSPQPTFRPSQSPSSTPGSSVAPTVSVVIDEGLVSLCLNNPATEQTTSSSRRLEISYAMRLIEGSDPERVLETVHDTFQATFSVYVCSYGKVEMQRINNGVDFLSLEYSPSPSFLPASCSLGTEDCYLVNTDFGVTYVGDPVLDTVLVTSLGPYFIEQMSNDRQLEKSQLENSHPNITDLEFRGFVNVGSTNSGPPEANKNGSSQDDDGPGTIGILLITIACTGAIGVLIGFIVLLRRQQTAARRDYDDLDILNELTICNELNARNEPSEPQQAVEGFEGTIEVPRDPPEDISSLGESGLKPQSIASIIDGDTPKENGNDHNVQDDAADGAEDLRASSEDANKIE